MRLLFALVLLLTVPVCSANAQKPVIVPGTHVSIAPPPLWTSSTAFSGFQDNGSGSSIVVTEMAGAPYSKTSIAFTKQDMAKRGMELVEKVSAVYGSHNGILLSARQSSRGENYVKWIACFGDKSQTVIITASVKVAYQAKQADAVVASLRSACINAGATVDAFDGLLFTIQAKEPYRMANRITSTIIFTPKGEFPTPTPTSPLFVVGSSLGGPQIADQETFARTRVKQIEMLSDINVYDAQKVALDGLAGIQLAATATDTKTRATMLVYQVILFDKDVYYIMQGISTQKEQAELSIWAEMVKSFKRRAGLATKP